MNEIIHFTGKQGTSTAMCHSPSPKETHSGIVDDSVVPQNSLVALVGGFQNRSCSSSYLSPLVGPQTEWANYPCDTALISADSSDIKRAKERGDT